MGRVINVCAVLHNLCIEHNVGIVEPNQDDNPYFHQPNVNNNYHLLQEAQRIRNNIVENYFN